jgi:hypothetical protein
MAALDADDYLDELDRERAAAGEDAAGAVEAPAPESDD